MAPAGITEAGGPSCGGGACSGRGAPGLLIGDRRVVDNGRNRCLGRAPVGRVGAAPGVTPGTEREGWSPAVRCGAGDAFVTGVSHSGVMEFRGSNGRSGGDLSAGRVRVTLPSASVERASPAVLKEMMRSASEAASRVAAFRARAAAEYSRRMGQRHAEKTLRQVSGASSRGARSEIETANRLKDLPGTRRAFEDGQINPGHVKIIAKTSGRVEIDEQELVEKAKRQPVDVFAHTARKHEQQRSGDDGVSRLETQKKSRRAWIRTDRDDGMTVLYARFDPITGALVKNALSTRNDLLWREEDRDRPRTSEQRLADALAQLVSEPGGAGNVKRRPGATLFVVAHYDAVAGRLGDAALADGTPIPVEALKRLACDAGIVPAFFDGKGRPLWVGRTRRLATRAQRRALYARDGGCVGCGVDPDWCEAHHIIFWEAGGPTDIDNLCLLCRRCHHQVHDDGWRIRRTRRGGYVMAPPIGASRPPRRRSVGNRRRRRRDAQPERVKNSAQTAKEHPP